MQTGETDWFADESFWERTFPFMFPEEGFVNAAGNVERVKSLTGVTGGSVLDLCCGPGRYAIPFARQGWVVTAVDRTRFLLDKARERAESEGVTGSQSIVWVEQDMRDFVRPDSFDLALNLFTSFGFFDDWAENRRVLENVLTSLKPCGAFVLDHVGKELLAQRFMPTLSSEAEGALIIHRNRAVDDWSRIEGDWILLEGERATRFQIRHWLYSGRELRELLTSVGFVDVKLFGNYDGAPYDNQAQRLIAVAKKPAA